jgi:uncharacterized cupredoxin-like copper-binding protein
MKRMFSVLVLSAAAGAMLFALVPYAGAKTTATTVKVTAKDTFRFALSRRTAPHGKVIFKVLNRGRLSHDFKIAGKKTKMLKHNQTATLTVTLQKGKRYTYLCTVPGHAAAGMKGIFKAT